jgi:hypothetical protein
VHATRFLTFIASALPHADKQQRAFCADLLKTTLSAIGEKISEQGRSAHNVEQLAPALGDMLCAYLEKTGRAARR